MEFLRVGQHTSVQLRQLLKNNIAASRSSTISLLSPNHLHLPSTVRPTFRSRPLVQSRRFLHTTPKNFTPLPSPLRTRLNNKLRSQQKRRWDSSDATSGDLSKPDSQLSLGQRLKKMSKDYGWAALGVYLSLSALDLPFCFLAVKYLGTDTIGHWEHVIVSYVKGVLQWPISGTAQEQLGDAAHRVAETVDKSVATMENVVYEGKRLLDDTPAPGSASGEETYAVEHGYKEAEAANTGENASLWTQLALAYAIHKSFIFVRVPLTAAILPKVVKTLRGWGWNIGPTRKAKAIAAGQNGGVNMGGVNTGGVNTKGSRVRPGG